MSQKEPAEKIDVEKPWFYRLMTNKDIEPCLKLWADAGFNEDKKTCVCALEETPDGLYVAEMKETGEIIGTCSASLVGPDTAFVGFYVVKPDLQGKGIGRDLWALTYDKVYPTMNIGLTAVMKMYEKYRSCGMREEDPYSNVIYQLDASEGAREKFRNLPGAEQLDPDCQLIEINNDTDEDLFQQLCGYNELIQGFSREKWLRCFLKGQDCPLSMVVVRNKSADSVVGKQREIIGFGCLRADNFGGATIGPLYADSCELSEIIMKSLVEKFNIQEGKPYSIIIYKGNDDGLKSIEQLGFTYTEEYPRIFSRFVPKAANSKIYGIHSAGFTLF